MELLDREGNWTSGRILPLKDDEKYLVILLDCYGDDLLVIIAEWGKGNKRNRKNRWWDVSDGMEVRESDIVA
jgi:hypothetical protein